MNLPFKRHLEEIIPNLTKEEFGYVMTFLAKLGEAVLKELQKVSVK